MRYLGVILIFMCSNAFSKTAYPLKNNPIYHAIKILNSNLKGEEAYTYSNLIAKYSRMYGLNPFRLVSIARQESHTKLSCTRELRDDEVTMDGEKFLILVETEIMGIIQD